jgi:hypothetical protein
MTGSPQMDRRLHPRARNGFNVTVGTKGMPELPVTALNISASGIYCISSKRLGDLTRVEIVLRMDENHTINARAVVIREEELPDETFGIGLFFTRISTEDREYISKYVNGLQ